MNLPVYRRVIRVIGEQFTCFTLHGKRDRRILFIALLNVHEFQTPARKSHEAFWLSHQLASTVVF
jgi:hypothetical protein